MLQFKIVKKSWKCARIHFSFSEILSLSDCTRLINLWPMMSFFDGTTGSLLHWKLNTIPLNVKSLDLSFTLPDPSTSQENLFIPPQFTTHPQNLKTLISEVNIPQKCLILCQIQLYNNQLTVFCFMSTPGTTLFFKKNLGIKNQTLSLLSPTRFYQKLKRIQLVAFPRNSGFWSQGLS